MEKWIWKDRRDIECSHQVDYDVFDAEKEDNLRGKLPQAKAEPMLLIGNGTRLAGG